MNNLFVDCNQKTSLLFAKNGLYNYPLFNVSLILQGDVGLPGPAGPPPSTGELEFMGFPKGKKGSKVANLYYRKNYLTFSC